MSSCIAKICVERGSHAGWVCDRIGIAILAEIIDERIEMSFGYGVMTNDGAEMKNEVTGAEMRCDGMEVVFDRAEIENDDTEIVFDGKARRLVST